VALRPARRLPQATLTLPCRDCKKSPWPALNAWEANAVYIKRMCSKKRWLAHSWTNAWQLTQCQQQHPQQDCTAAAHAHLWRVFGMNVYWTGSSCRALGRPTHSGCSCRDLRRPGLSATTTRGRLRKQINHIDMHGQTNPRGTTAHVPSCARVSICRPTDKCIDRLACLTSIDSLDSNTTRVYVHFRPRRFITRPRRPLRCRRP